MITISIFTILLLFITGILFIPLRLVINTKSNEYFVSLPGYFRADLLLGLKKRPSIKARLFFFTFKIEPNKNIAKKTKNDGKQHKMSLKNTRSRIIFLNQCIRQIKVKELSANVDTGDFPLNAQLIPVANTLNHGNIQLNINFENQNSLKLKTSTQVFKFIKPGIMYLMSNK
jgi:hypothetical protein